MNLSEILSKQFLSLIPFMVSITLLISSCFAIFRNKGNVKRALVTFWSVTTLLYACHTLYFNNMMEVYPLSTVVYDVCNLLVYPLFLYYLFTITQEKPYPFLYFTIPAIVGGIATLSCYFACAENYGQFIREYLYKGNHVTSDTALLVTCIVHDICKVIFAAEVITVLFWGIRLVRAFNHRIDSFYSNNEEKSLNKITILLKIIFVISIFSFVFNILGRQFFENSIVLLSIPALLFTINLVFLGTTCLQQQFTIHDLVFAEQGYKYGEDIAHETVKTSTTPVLSQKKSDELWDIINREVTENRLFTYQNFNVSELSARINVNRTYIQQAIKDHTGRTFLEYTNETRLAYAEMLRKENPSRLIKSIIQEAGFASPSAYYRAQKKTEKDKELE